ncbi:MAG: Rieske 2Fe-2S domain-containing protein [Acidimicrobiales bacterium]
MPSSRQSSTAVTAPGHLVELLERVERAELLDRPGSWSSSLVHRLLPGGPVKDALSGSWLGHPLHPALVATPIGLLGSMPLLDLLGGRSDAALRRRILGLGLLAALPAATAGLVDWSDTRGAEQRTGLVHALVNVAALGAFTRSWWRRRGGRGGSVAAVAGTTLLVAGGWLGGHLAYALGVGVDTTLFRAGPSEWEDVGDEASLGTGKPVPLRAGRVGLVAFRGDGDQVWVLESRCTHRGGPLAEGITDGECVTCPWHGSRFRLEDGSVVGGPAVRPQPAYEARLSAGRLQVRRAEPRTLRKNPV